MMVAGIYSEMTGGNDIYNDIIETLKENGDIDDQTFRQYVLFALVDLGRGKREIDQIKKKVERLERNSIILIAKKYPKVSVTILGFFVVFVIAGELLKGLLP
jgi:hypothetical protein